MPVTAPYNFVPLSKHVCAAADLGLDGLPSQDVPLPEGLSGAIAVTLTTEGPVLVSGGPGEDKTFFETPDGNLAIPGSSWRGMIRNVLEIAAFGKMALVEDQRTTVRDLTATARLDYGGRLNSVRAGWLRFPTEEERDSLTTDPEKQPALVLEPCTFLKVKHTSIDTLAPGFSALIRSLSLMPQPDARNAQQVQQGLTSRHAAMDVRFDEVDGRAVLRSGSGGKTGTLVFTGLPGSEKINDPTTGLRVEVSKKKNEFVFFGGLGLKPVFGDVWKKFIQAHEMQEKPSETWKWRRKALYGGKEAIPVFWMPDQNGGVEHIGLAMMFKLPADNSVGDMIDKTSKTHRDPSVLDLPTRIFGRIDDGGVAAFRTRVSFGWLTGPKASPDPLPTYEAHLQKPKPSYTPAYVRQRDFAAADGKRLLELGQGANAQYRSYMNWPKPPLPNQKEEQIRGWKRYPARKATTDLPEAGPATPASPGEKARGASRLTPMGGPGTEIEFKGTLRYHNLAPVELGALVWALTWGGDGRLCHALGMGRPLGWGKARISLNLPEAALVAMMKPFTDAMKRWGNRHRIPGEWGKSIQIRQLLAMADPDVGAAQSASLEAMTLDPHGDNAFAEARKAGQVLPEYGLTTVADVTGNLDPASIKSEVALTAAKRAEILATNAALMGARTPAGPVRFEVGDFVAFRTAGHFAGRVKRLLGDDRFAVEYWRTQQDLSRGPSGQDQFHESAMLLFGTST